MEKKNLFEEVVKQYEANTYPRRGIHMYVSESEARLLVVLLDMFLENKDKLIELQDKMKTTVELYMAHDPEPSEEFTIGLGNHVTPDDI